MLKKYIGLIVYEGARPAARGRALKDGALVAPYETPEPRVSADWVTAADAELLRRRFTGTASSKSSRSRRARRELMSRLTERPSPETATNEDGACGQGDM